MVKFTNDYVDELNEFHSKGFISVLYVAFCYIRGVLEVLCMFALLYHSNTLDEGGVACLACNTFANYATVSIVFNSFLSCLMHFGGGNEINSFVALMVSGAAKVQIFHPRSVYRNVIMRPAVAGLLYATVVCLNVVTLNPPNVGEILTPQFFIEAYFLGNSINAATGILKTIFWHWAYKREPIFNVESIVDGVECGSKTSPDTDRTHDESHPQNDNLEPISEGGENVPPKSQNYFSCSV